MLVLQAGCKLELFLNNKYFRLKPKQQVEFTDIN